MHNNYLELRAICAAITTARFSNVFIRVFTDNTSSMHMINKLYTRVDQCAIELKHILTYLLAHDCAIKAYHIPGPLNKVSDYLSRTPTYSQRVSKVVFTHV